MKRTVRRLVQHLQAISKILSFKPKVKLLLTVGNYQVRTVRKPRELHEAILLRQKVFFEERGVIMPWVLDFDDFDLLCDHLVIEDMHKSKIIGTYRVLSSEFTDKFYSQKEFDMADFLSRPGGKLELGRCCIHPDYRNGIVLDMLWKGLAQYCAEVDAQFMFGCSSVMTNVPMAVAQIKGHFESTLKKFNYNVSTTPEFSLELPQETFLAAQEINFMVPSLLKSYIRAGAEVFSQPAYDKEFQCFDFLTILNLGEMHAKYRSKYFSQVAATNRKVRSDIILNRNVRA